MYSVKVKDTFPLENAEVLVFFEDGKTKKFDVKPLISEYPEFEDLNNPDIFQLLKVEPGGYGISWTEDADCSEVELYEKGIDIPLSLEDFRIFVRNCLVTTNEACTLLNCSRQNIDDLVKREKLHPVRVLANGKLFFRTEVERRIG